MPYQLDFQIKYLYPTTADGITIPVSLSVGDVIVDARAKVDCGAAFCLFQREIADELGIDVESGIPMRMSTLTGTLPTFGHSVTLQFFDVAYDSIIFFASYHNIPRNLLGMNGWMNRLLLGLDSQHEVLYLNPTL